MSDQVEHPDFPIGARVRHRGCSAPCTGTVTKWSDGQPYVVFDDGRQGPQDAKNLIVVPA